MTEPVTAPPRVSVCIPVFNGQAHIAAAIESVLGQTLRDFELIVFDNASTDATLDVVGTFDDPRLRIVTGDVNIGAAANWNRCLHQAASPLVKILCADDVLEPECLARQAAALDSAPGAVLCACGRLVIDEDGTVLMTRRWSRRTRVLPGRELLGAMVRSGTNLVGEPSAVLLRASAVRRVDGFDERAGYSIDMEMWSRLLAEGDIVMMSEALVRFRISTSSWSVAVRSRQASDTIETLRRIVTRSPTLGNRIAFVLGAARAHLNSVLRRALYLVWFRRTGRV